MVHGRKKYGAGIRGKGGEASLEGGNRAGGRVGVQDYLPAMFPSLLGYHILFVSDHNDKGSRPTFPEGGEDPGQERLTPGIEQSLG